MSPTILALSAKLPRGDFQALFLAGANTATGRPRRVMVMGPPRCSISSRKARHLALNSVALTTRSFIICLDDSNAMALLDGSLGQCAVQRAQHRFGVVLASWRCSELSLGKGDGRRL